MLIVLSIVLCEVLNIKRTNKYKLSRFTSRPGDEVKVQASLPD